MVARSASHSRAADSTSVSSTVCRSKVERLMTLSTSAVAVCCCSDSRSSLSKRAFSMAMTAWLAKLVSSSICLSVNGERTMRMLHANHHRLTLPPLDIGRRRTVQRGHAEAISLGKVQIAKRGLAEARRVRQHGLEHGLKLARRARDDAQDLRGRRLLLQRLGEMLL